MRYAVMIPLGGAIGWIVAELLMVAAGASSGHALPRIINVIILITFAGIGAWLDRKKR